MTAAAGRRGWRILRWYHTPFYVIVLPVMAGGWLLRQFVDAGFDLYEAITGRHYG